MKVPVPVTSRTTQFGGRLTPVRVDGVSIDAFGGGMARGLGAVGEALNTLGTTVQRKNEQNAKFQTLTNFTEFETRVAQALTELKRGASPDGKGYLAAASQLYKKEEDSFFAGNVPPELEQEFRSRAAAVRQGILADSLTFQYAASDAHFKQGLSDMLSKAQTDIDQNPGNTEKWKTRINEAIDTQTDLPEIEKANLKRNFNISMLKTEFTSNIQKGAIAAATAGGMSGTALGMTMAIIEKHEGYQDNAYPDSRTSDGSYAGHRVGFGSDTVTHPDGTYSKVTPGTKTTRADAERDVKRRIAEFNKGIMDKVGADRWNALPPNIQAPLTSVAYNYGSLPDSVANAVRTGDVTQIANAVEALSANKKRRKEEADVIRGAASIPAINVMSDPRYADIPYEDKVLLRSDAEARARSAANEAEQQAKQAQQTRLNDLYTSLFDGTAGRVQIDEARQAGWLNDYDDINKANTIYDNRNKNANLAANAQVKLNSPGAVWDPTDDTDKKMLNAYIGERGIAAITSMDTGYFNDVVVPTVAKAQDIPTDVVGALTGMMRSTNQQQALFALDSLSMLNANSAKAFAARVPEAVAKDVDYYEARKQLVPTDEIMRSINSTLTPQERAAEQQSRKDAREWLRKGASTTSGSVANLDRLAQEYVGSKGWFWNPVTAGATPAGLRGLQQDYATLFEDNFVRTNNPEIADQLTRKELDRQWGVTQVGSSNVLMKRPPELAGYRPLAGSYNWINDQVRSELKMGDGDKFELYSDPQTEDEFRRWQLNPDSPPPSYRIMKIDEFGVARPSMNERNQFNRLNFKPPQEAVQKEINQFDYDNERSRINERISSYNDAEFEAAASGRDIPPEMQEQYQADIKRLEELRGQSPEVVDETKKIKNQYNPTAPAGTPWWAGRQ